MKRMLLAAAAALPLCVTAQDVSSVDTETLRHAIPASALLEEDVMTQDDRHVGEVEDVLITRNGELRLFLVDMEDADLGDDGEGDTPMQPEQESETDEFGEPMEVESDMTAKGGEPERAIVNRGDIEWGEDLVPVSPRDVRYDRAADRLLMRTGASPSAVPEEDHDELLGIDEIIGMEVNLADEESFGEVEDVMIDSEQSRVVALVVDNWDGFDKQRRALPANNAIIRSDEEEIVYPYTLEQVRAMNEFDMDEYTEDGWQQD